jgi:hypothetical protein
MISEDIAREWQAFEALPPAVREALRNADYAWPATDVQPYCQGRRKPETVVKMIASWDRLQRKHAQRGL